LSYPPRFQCLAKPASTVFSFVSGSTPDGATRPTKERVSNMALNENEKELLAVVKYYNDQRKPIAKLVKKLVDGFGVEATGNLTGYTDAQIYAAVKSIPARKPRQKKQPVEPIAIEEAEKLIVNTKLKPKTVPVIQLHADSPTHERVAYEMSMQIGDKFKSGDAFYTTKTAMETFEIGQETARGAMRLLHEKGLIEYANGNFRNGYVVK
jgi:hypothetical protein